MKYDECRYSHKSTHAIMKDSFCISARLATDYTLFPGVSVRMFLKEISIWIRLSSQCGWASFNLLRAWTEQKMEEGVFCPFLTNCFIWDVDSLYSDSWCQAFIPVLESRSLACLDLRTQNKLTDFPVSPACRQQMVGLLFFHNCMSRFCHNKLLYTYRQIWIYVILVLIP